MPACWVLYDFGTCRSCARDIFRVQGTERWFHATCSENCWPSTKAQPRAERAS